MDKLIWLNCFIMTKNNRDNEKVRCCQLRVKTNICVLLAVLMLFISLDEIAIKAAPEKEAKAPYINARCAVALDAKTKRVLFEKDSHMITPMASTTKIITALVAIKYGDLDRKVVISERASSIRGSEVGYKAGEEVKLRELIYGLMLRSGNDAAIAIAEDIGGSIEKFSKLMNEYAAEIGMVDSHFESPHGLDSELHYTTAYDLALATAKAKETKEFNEIVASKDILKEQFGFTRDFHNINKILWLLPDANGVKTGYTGKAGKCLVSSVKKNNNEIIMVVIDCSQRWKETAKIYEYVGKRYEFIKVAAREEIIDSIDLPKNRSKVNMIAKEDVIVPVKAQSKVDIKNSKPKVFILPLNKNEQLGTLNIYEDNKLIYKTPLYSDKKIEKGSFSRKWFWLNKKH